MGAVNVVLLLLLVRTFAAACKAECETLLSKYRFSITCRNVTGHVGKESTLNCEVSYPNNTCCMMMFRFINTSDTTMCEEEFRKDFTKDPCLRFPSISCPYTANEAMMTTFKFFLQTTCENKTAEFTVNITDAVKDVTGGPNRKGDPTKETPVQLQTDETWIVIIMAAIICSIIFVMGFSLIRKHNANTCGFQRNCMCDIITEANVIKTLIKNYTQIK